MLYYTNNLFIVERREKKMKTEEKCINYDLHLHTISSDGRLTPEELVDRAMIKELDCIAITDHDTIQSVSIAQNYIQQKNYPLKCLSGVEISTKWRSHEIHIVGLNFDPHSKVMHDLLEIQKNLRMERSENIAQKLEKLGCTDVLTKVQKIAQGDIVSRSHFAQLLVKEDAVDSIEKAFKRYLGSKGKAYIAPNWISMEQAIDVIHQAKGVAVLAHPLRYRLNTASVKKLLREFKALTGDGMEVAQNRQTDHELMLLSRWSNEFQLLASRGSDFHAFSDYHDVGRCRLLPDHLIPIWSVLHF